MGIDRARGAVGGVDRRAAACTAPPNSPPAGHDPQAIGRTVIQSFLRQAIRDGFFHADMHQGNLLVDAEGRLVAVDFGIMGRLGSNERRFLAEILLGFILRDYRRVAKVHFEAGYVPAHHSVEDFAQAIRAIGEPIHQRRADEISMAKVLTLLFDITALFDMSTRTELVMLQKTMVVVEGVARSLDPRLDMWTTAEPVVRSWIARNMGPVGRAQSGLEALRVVSDVVGDIPDLATRLKRVLVRLDETGAERRAPPGALRPGNERRRAIWSTAGAVGHRGRRAGDGVPRVSERLPCRIRPASTCRREQRADSSRASSASPVDALGQNPVGLPGEAPAVLGGDVLGGEHNHRHVTPFRPRAQRPQEGEAVHLRHHQVEQDQGRAAPRRPSPPGHGGRSRPRARGKPSRRR